MGGRVFGGVNYTYDGDGKRVQKSNGTLYNDDESELDQVDLQRTVDENAKLSVQFVLKPNPSSISDTAK